MDKKGKIALSDELLDKVSGGTEQIGEQQVFTCSNCGVAGNFTYLADGWHCGNCNAVGTNTMVVICPVDFS